MLKRFPFGPYEPDKPLSVSGALNVWPMEEGYRPVKSFSAITPALAGILGGGAFMSSTGTSVLLAGTASNLYKYSGTAWTSVLGSLSTGIWRFSQFGDLVIGVNGGSPIKYDMLAGTAANLGGYPPGSDMVATVRQQVFLAGDPSNRNLLTISGYNDAQGYTPGTNQSLAVPFPSGGDIMGLCGGETGIILQKQAVRRATYTGDVTVWQFDEIAHDIGCMAKGSVVQSGQLVFFLSEQGFKICDRNTVMPIGSEKIDREFFATYSRASIQSITAAIDPHATTVSWCMPGTPGKLWSYNWTLQKWSTAAMSTKLVFNGYTANISIDAIDALYPGGIDVLPYSLDAAIFQGGNPLFLIADAGGVVGALTGPNLAAQFVTKAIEVAPGRRVRVRGARAVSDAVTGTVTLDVRARAGDAQNNRVSGSVRDNGRVPLRANGRHVGMTLDIPAGAVWTYALGLDLEFEAEGSR